MGTDSSQKVATIIGARIRKARKEGGLTQEQLAAPQFTKGYISALERGSVRPSLKALQYLASRLQLPLTHFVAGVEMAGAGLEQIDSAREPELEALQEDLNYQYNYARMLIRSGGTSSVKEGLGIIQEAEKAAARYSTRLPARLLYRPHFLRGLAYLQDSRPELARPELEVALQAAGTDAHASTAVRNMLGVAFYLLEQPSNALHHHLQCLYAVEKSEVKDLSLRLSILHNLGNDYWALRDVPQAISTYRQALALVDDLNGVERQANLFWALAIAYRAAGDWPQARLYAGRALHLYETLDDLAGAAAVCMHLAELLTQDGRYGEAKELLAKAGEILAATSDNVLLSNLHYDHADIDRKMGNLESAAEHAKLSLELIEGVAGLSDGEYGPTADAKTGTKRSGKESPGSKGETEAHASGAGGEKADRATSYSSINITNTYVEALHAAALVEEARENRAEADRLFQRAQHLLKGTELVELAHTIYYSYGNVLSDRGEFKRATEQYRLAALAGAGRNNP